MADKTFPCRVITPEREVFNDTVKSVVLPGVEGNFGVLINHTPYMADLEIGEIKVITEDGTRFIACSGGFAKVDEDGVTVLAETAEAPGDIDVERARDAYKRARDRLHQEDLTNLNVQRAEDAVERARTRLNVAGVEVDEDEELTVR